MTSDLRRRTLLQGALGAAGLTALGPLAAAAQDNVRMRMYWWGSKERADRTFKANELYQARHPGATIDGETLGWAEYWQRLATQAAGRNAPDIIQMDYRYIFEYARREALLPLDEYLGKSLDVADFGTSLDGGKVDGKLYGINLGNNSTSLVYSKTAFEAAGLKAPDHETTWSQFAELSVELTKASKDGYYGTSDAGGEEVPFEVWLRQRGKSLYTAEGKLGMDATDAADWFAMWADMREKKACPPADVQALDKNNIETNMLTQGKAACSFAHSNQMVGYQAVNQHKLGMTMYPQGGDGAKPGQYLKPSMFWSIYARSKVAEDAVKVINFYLRDPEAIRALGVERGVPASPAGRDAVASVLDETGKTAVDYIAFVSTRVGPLPPAPPKGAGEIQVLVRRINEQVGFGRVKPADAGKQYISEANAILTRG